MTEALNNDYALPVQAQVTTVQTQVADGWVADANTWTYVSADSPSFVASVNADMTGTISVGMRIRLTQTTVKYFIVTAVGSYSAGATELTLYGGTDYTLADAEIASPGYSNVKAPFGFPLNPEKWTVEVVNSGDFEQLSPTTGVWYNAEIIVLPIGAWNVQYRVFYSIATSGTQYTQYYFITLSDGAATESNARMTRAFFFSTLATLFGNSSSFAAEDLYVVSVETPLYLNIKSDYSVDSIGIYGTDIPTVIRAVCAYL